MIVAMLVLIAFISATDFMLTKDTYWGSEVVKEVHEASASTLLPLSSSASRSFEHGENLVRAMVTGLKRQFVGSEQTPLAANRPADGPQHGQGGCSRESGSEVDAGPAQLN